MHNLTNSFGIYLFHLIISYFVHYCTANPKNLRTQPHSSVIIKGLSLPFICTLKTLYQVFQDILLQGAAEPIAVTGKGGTAHTQRYS